MLSALLGGTLAFLVTYYAIPVILVVSKLKNLNDMPDFRKVHHSPISPLGGLGIFCGFIVAFLLSGNLSGLAGYESLQYIVGVFLIAFFLGIKDDILVLSPLKKFLGQLLIAGILVFKGKFLLTSFDGLFGIGILPPIVSYILSLLLILAIINAYNLVDGLDGLAGTLGAIASLFFAVMLWLSGDVFYALLGFTFTGSLLAFLRYNFSPARIFMGDVGAMLIGIVVAILAIRFMSHHNLSQRYAFMGSPALAIAPMIVPVLDMLRLFFVRPLQKKSPFLADRSHLHHLLFAGGLTQRQVVFFLSILTLLNISGSYLLLHAGAISVILVQIIFFYPITVIFQLLRKSNRNLRSYYRRSAEDDKQMYSILSPADAEGSRPAIVSSLKLVPGQDDIIEKTLPM